MEPTQRVSDILADLKRKGLVTDDNKLMTEQVKEQAKVQAQEIAKAATSGNPEDLIATLTRQQESLMISFNSKIMNLQDQINVLNNKVEELSKKSFSAPKVETHEAQAPANYTPSTNYEELEKLKSQAPQNNNEEHSSGEEPQERKPLPTNSAAYSQRRGNYRPGDVDIYKYFGGPKK